MRSPISTCAVCPMPIAFFRPPTSWRSGGSRPLRSDETSAADTQFVDDHAVALGILPLEVLQQAATLADQLQQAAARMVIFLVQLEVIGQAVDPFRQDRD